MLTKIRRLFCRVPELPEGKWFHSRGHKLHTDQKTTLLFFWSFCDVACTQTLAFIRKLHKKYGAHLSIIGVYVPLYPFESYATTRKELKKHRITFPVLFDQHKEYWYEFHGFLPWISVLNPDQKIVFEHQADRNHHEISAAITETLNDSGVLVPIVYSKLGREPQGVHPTTYACCGNRFCLLSGPHVRFYKDEKLLSNRNITLYGRWVQHKDFVRHAEMRQGFMWITFHGRQAYAVLEAKKPVEVRLDGQPIPKKMAGRDIIRKQRKTYIHTKRGALYHLLNTDVPDHYRLKLLPDAGDLKVFSFSFE